MTKEEYAELLKRPEWKAVRLRILERDNYTCQKCGKKRKYLQVHHLRYPKSGIPWESPDEDLVTLCMFCHEMEHAIKNTVVAKPILTDEKPVLSIIDFSKLKDLFTPENCILFLIFLKICDMVEYNTNRTKMGVNGFKTIRKSVSCKEKKVKENITLLKRLCYLKNNDGFWYVNPHIYWKGDIENKDAACRKYDKMK